MEIDMKTIMDAVNELKGDLDGCVNGSGENCNVLLTCHTGQLYCSKGFYGSEGWSYVSTIAEFKGLVKELSHSTWIKGASLAEYQAADKEVLKVENKTVEVDEIGRYEENAVYELSDKTFVVLESYNGVSFRVSRIDDPKNSWFVDEVFECANTIYYGKIKPAPVKLVDGQVYAFMCFNKKYYGEYHKSLHRFYCGDYYYTTDDCTSITRLVPEGANSLSK